MFDGITRILDKTSATESEPKELKNTIRKLDKVKVYHILLDCDYGSKHSLISGHSQTFGKIRKQTGTDYIAVLYDFKKATSVAERMIYQTAMMGTIGNKQHPVFGAIILGIELLNTNERNYDLIEKTQYSMLKIDEITRYRSTDRDKTETERGLIKKSVLSGAKIVTASYITSLETTTTVGFCLHNLNPALTPEDIRELKKLHKRSGEEISMLELDVPDESGSPLEGGNKYKTQYGKTIQSGSGSKVDYDVIGNDEKVRYMQLCKTAKKYGAL